MFLFYGPDTDGHPAAHYHPDDPTPKRRFTDGELRSLRQRVNALLEERRAYGACASYRPAPFVTDALLKELGCSARPEVDELCRLITVANDVRRARVDAGHPPLVGEDQAVRVFLASRGSARITAAEAHIERESGLSIGECRGVIRPGRYQDPRRARLAIAVATCRSSDADLARVFGRPRSTVGRLRKHGAELIATHLFVEGASMPDQQQVVRVEHHHVHEHRHVHEVVEPTDRRLRLVRDDELSQAIDRFYDEEAA
jgi:hypothetical protein